MIVKNEEKVISRCLECLKDIVDEMIIVDTGSTDSTKPIASEYTDKIFDFKWIDDFSAARNFSFSKATMDYIYVADADEILDEENREKFRNLKSNLDSSIDIVEMEYGNQLEMGSTYNFDVENRPKLYKRLRTFRWKDPIHEVVECYNNCFTSDIRIIHKPEKLHASRDLSIFEKVVSEGKALSSRLHMMYARELYIAGNDENLIKAYEYFNNSLTDSNMTDDDKRLSHCVLARYYNLKSDSYNLLKIATKNMRGAASAEICCELGDSYLRERDFEEAIYWYYTAANAASADLVITSAEFTPNIGLCRCFIESGDMEEASRYNETAALYKPDDPAVLANQKLLEEHLKK